MVTVYQDCSSHRDRKKHGRQGTGHIYNLYTKKKKKKKSCQKLLDRFQYDLAEIFE